MFIVLSVTICTVGYICVFRGDQIIVDFVSFLSMIIYEVLLVLVLLDYRIEGYKPVKT